MIERPKHFYVSNTSGQQVGVIVAGNNTTQVHLSAAADILDDYVYDVRERYAVIETMCHRQITKGLVQPYAVNPESVCKRCLSKTREVDSSLPYLISLV